MTSQRHSFFASTAPFAVTAAFALATPQLAQAACVNGDRDVIQESLSLFGGVGAGLAVDAGDNLYIAENTADRVRRIAPDGQSSFFVAAPDICSVTDLEFDNDGNLLVADGVGNGATGRQKCNRVVRVAPDGTATDLLTINNPGGVAVDAAGNIYVTSYDDRNLQRFLPDGTFDQIVATFPETPLDVELGPAGDLYVAGWSLNGLSNGTKIYRVSPDGTSAVFADPGIIDPHSLAFDGDGHLFASYYNSTVILEFAPDGALAATHPGGGSAGNDAANGIVINADGDLFSYVNGGRTTSSAAVVKLCGIAEPAPTCAADADNDGVCDDVDGCPDDPDKDAPGVCGCSVADDDLDNNGLVDCTEDPTLQVPLASDAGLLGLAGLLALGAVGRLRRRREQR